jgi:tetratricopeptide (TPR) repeat protein
MDFDYSKTRKEVETVPLNELLDGLEIDVSRVGQGKLDNALKMLVKLDEALQRIESMAQKKLPVKAESAQFDYLVSELEKNASKALHDLGGAKQLDELRRQRPGETDNRWWHLDEIYTDRRRKIFRRILFGIGGIGLLFVVLIIVYNAFLKPDPAVSGKYTHQMNALQMLTQGDYTKAIDEINLALGFSPSDPELLVLRGVTQTKLGHTDQANQDFNAAESKLGNRISFLLFRSQSWISVGDYQKSIADSQEIINEDPSSAEGYYYLGRANELLQNYTAAINAYETASQLANTQGKVELDATIRISLAILMQSTQGDLLSTQPLPTP